MKILSIRAWSDWPSCDSWHAETGNAWTLTTAMLGPALLLVVAAKYIRCKEPWFYHTIISNNQFYTKYLKQWNSSSSSPFSANWPQQLVLEYWTITNLIELSVKFDPEHTEELYEELICNVPLVSEIHELIQCAAELPMLCQKLNTNSNNTFYYVFTIPLLFVQFTVF